MTMKASGMGRLSSWRDVPGCSAHFVSALVWANRHNMEPSLPVLQGRGTVCGGLGRWSCREKDTASPSG